MARAWKEWRWVGTGRAVVSARVRTFKRLENIFALCVMAYVFMTKYLRGSKRFKKIIKLLGDNVETLAFKIHSLLSAIRELYLEAKV